MQSDTCPLIRPELAQLSSVKDLSACLSSWHKRINSADELVNNGIYLLTHNSAIVDNVLRRLFELSVEGASALAPAGGDPPRLAVVATGGYGRRELSPFSDIDVTFISAIEDDPYLNAIIKAMFERVMDVFQYGVGLKVGYAYRLLGDLGQLDHQTQTTLLDSRLLCGDAGLFREFRAQFRAQLLEADFIFQKWAERIAVREKFGTTVYAVEPDVKEGAGGLRDAHNAEWIGEVRFHVGLPKLWTTFVEKKIVSADDAAAVVAARAFLNIVRAALHIVAGEARNTLTTEKQEAIAAMLQYDDNGDTPAVETFMREYYAHAAHLHRISGRVVERCLDSEMPLSSGLASVNRAIQVVDDKAAARDRVLPLHLAELAQAYDLAVPADTEEYIAQYLRANPRPADPAAAGRVFTRLLTTGASVADTLERLTDWGVLAWLMPEFDALMGLIPYDAAHDFTVGAHSLRVVRFLENIRSETDTKLATLRRLSGEVAFPEVLLLAGLLHDVGKQWPQGHHAETGAEAASAVAARLGWDSERTTKLVWLVNNHLLMAETSRLRDLALNETIRDFVRVVPDIDALNMLYLLTYADTLAVGAGVWTEVKGRFLGELYHRAEGAMAVASDDGTEPVLPSIASTLARQRERIKKGLAQHDLPIDLIHEHTRNLPAQYLLNTPIDEMYLHIAMVGRLRETYQPIIDFRTEFGTDFTEMTLCAYDDPQPGLLAKITGVLYANDVNVHVAQVFTREASVRIALDTLWVDYRAKPLTTGKKADVQADLRRVLKNEIGLAELLQQKKKPIKEQTIYSATIDDKSSDRFSILEVSAPDERGVVYRLTRAISLLRWNIHAARISVWGSRARDAFYVTGPDGRKVPAADVKRIADVLPMAAFSKRSIARSPDVMRPARYN